MNQGNQSSREFRNKSRIFLELCRQFERKDQKKEIEQAIQLMTQAHSEEDHTLKPTTVSTTPTKKWVEYSWSSICLENPKLNLHSLQWTINRKHNLWHLKKKYLELKETVESWDGSTKIHRRKKPLTIAQTLIVEKVQYSEEIRLIHTMLSRFSLWLCLLLTLSFYALFGWHSFQIFWNR